LFAKYQTVIAIKMKQLIFWPSKEVSNNLYLHQFRNSLIIDIESIIDCFEIQVQKPLNPVHQSLTWSDYKMCNSIVYMLSIYTKDGLISFVAIEYGGRTSDVLNTELSDFLDTLPVDGKVDSGLSYISI